MNPIQDFYFYSWEEFDADCEKIAQWAKDKNFTNVYGIPRGGLVVAVKISHLLDIPMIFGINDISIGTLVVDDIVDKGNTLIKIKKLINIPNLATASLYLGSESLIQPDFFVNMKIKESWVVFPWETRQSSRYDGTF